MGSASAVLPSLPLHSLTLQSDVSFSIALDNTLSFDALWKGDDFCTIFYHNSFVNNPDYTPFLLWIKKNLAQISQSGSTVLASTASFLLHPNYWSSSSNIRGALTSNLAKENWFAQNTLAVSSPKTFHLKLFPSWVPELFCLNL